MKLPKFLKPFDRQSESLSSRDAGSPDHFTIIDVGAASVRAAIISAQDDQVTFLGYGHQAQLPDTMNAGLINQLQNLSDTIEQAVTKASNQAGLVSDQVILGLGDSLVSGLSTLARLNRPKPKDKINRKELDQILERVAQNVLIDNQEEISRQMAISPDQLRLINAAVTGFSLDGYHLASPINFSGREVEVSLFTAYVSDSTIVALQQILDQINSDLASLNSGAYSLAEAAVSLASKPSQSNAVVLDVGSGSTSATLIENGAVVNSRSYPIAGRAITAKLSQDLGLSMGDAEQTKLDYSSEVLTGKQYDNVHRIIKEEVDIWLHALSIALSQLSPGQALPDQIYLAGGGSQLSLIEKYLNKPKWTKALGFSRQPQVSRVHPNLFSKIVDQTQSLGSGDATLASLAVTWGTRQQADADIASAFHQIITRLH